MRNVIVGLGLVIFLLSCAKVEDEKFAGPKDNPFEGKWSHSGDRLHFADLEFKGNEIRTYLPLEKSKEKPPHPEMDIDRELLTGTYTAVSRENIPRINGRWTEVTIQIAFTHSTCSGLRPTERNVSRKLLFYYPKDGSERLFWGNRSDDPGFAHYERYNDDDREKKDTHKDLAKIRNVSLGCIVEGRFVSGRRLSPIP